jgi:hypothetical protein
MALISNCSNTSAPITDSPHLIPSVSPISHPTQSSSRPNANLLRIPLEIRLKILHLALLAASYDFEDEIQTGRLTAFPFNKPVIPVHLAELKHATYCPFWGSESMTRPMRVNKQLYHEVVDVLYKSFAIHLARWSPQKSLHTWVSSLQERNPRALTLVQHLNENVVFSGNTELSTIDDDGIYWFANSIIEDGKFLASNFPNLKTVVLSSFFHEKDLQGQEELTLAKHTEQILQVVKFWRSLKIEAYFSASVCAGPKGRWIIAEAQKRLGQEQAFPTVFNNTGSRCSVDGANIEYGCGRPE